MFVYTPHFIPSSIFLFGAGGTGSRLMPQLTQLVRTCIRKFNPTAWLERLPIYVIDGDRVEQKNLARQNFISKDVGEYKARVLANRYSTAFDVPIFPGNFFLGSGPEGATNVFGTTRTNLPFEGTSEKPNFSNSIIILAVDSAGARRAILNALGALFLKNGTLEANSQFIIDAGNEDNFGQVKFFTNSLLQTNVTDARLSDLKAQLPNSCPISKEVKFIPFDLNYYNQLGESNQEKSCSDLPQTLAINSVMASLICSVVQNFLYLKPMDHDCIRFGLDGSVHCDKNTAISWLNKVYPGKEHSSDNPGRTTGGQANGFLNSCFIVPQLVLGSSCIFTNLAREIRRVLEMANLRIDENKNIVPIPASTTPKLNSVEIEPAPKLEKVSPKPSRHKKVSIFSVDPEEITPF